MEKNYDSKPFSCFLKCMIDLKIVRYFFVGGIAAVVDLSLFFIFAKILAYNYLLVGAAAFSIAALVNYALSIRHVFISGARFCKHKEFFWVYFVSIIGLLFNQLILFMAIELVHLELMVSKIIAIGLVFFWNYLARKYFVFKQVSTKS